MRQLMKQVEAQVYMRSLYYAVLASLITLVVVVPKSVLATEVTATANIEATASNERPETAYSFISGSDLLDALTQESMTLQGYILGVSDALKHTKEPDRCFTIPLAANADELIYKAYAEYWRANRPIPENSLNAIIEAMHARYPCQ